MSAWDMSAKSSNQDEMNKGQDCKVNDLNLHDHTYMQSILKLTLLLRKTMG